MTSTCLRVLALALCLFGLAAGPAAASENRPATRFGGPDPSGMAMCYLVADNDNNGNSEDVLVSLSTSNEVTVLGRLGTRHVEGLTFDPGTETLYGADEDRLVIIDVSGPSYTEVGAFGSGDGPLGRLDFDDVDGLALDPSQGTLYASVRRDDEDLLIQVDMTTGRAVSGAFGGDDYLVVDYIYVGGVRLGDIDDIAIDPVTRKLYGVINESSLLSHLVEIDVTNGTVTIVADLGIGSVEGLGFQGDGTLVGINGDANPQVYVIDRAAATTTLRSAIHAGSNIDFESIACMTEGTNLITGLVFDDLVDLGQLNSGDGRLENIRIQLFRDADGDKEVSFGDILVGDRRTAADGTYSFVIAATGRFVLRVDASTVPAGYLPTTKTFKTANFVGFGNEDHYNNWGFAAEPEIELTLTKRVDHDEVAVGDEVTFTIEVTNTSDTEATGVVVADLMPDGFSILDSTPSLSRYGQAWHWNVGTLESGDSAEITITAAATRPGSHVNCAQVWRADQADRYSTFGSGYRDGEADDDCVRVTVEDPQGFAICYVVADNDLNGSSQDVLTRVVNGAEYLVGATGTIHLEALAFQPSSQGVGTLFGADGGRFGSLNLTDGSFGFIGEFGSGSGSLGNRDFDDVDGLTFDPFSGFLYGIVRRSQAGPDLLIRVDPSTGSAVEDAFGDDEYVPIETIDDGGLELDDVDDIAIDPVDGRMYGIINASGRKSHLVLIDKLTGGVTDLWDLDVENVEGLGFTTDHVLLGVLGDSDRQLVVIDVNSGLTTLVSTLGVGGIDYESVACMTDDVNRITGTVFFDEDRNGDYDNGDRGHAGVAVMLYRDGNGDGRLGHPTDHFLSSLVSGFDGFYAFDVAALGHFVVTTNLLTYPAGSVMTTTNLHTAYFTGFGQIDEENDFGFYAEQQAPRNDLELTKVVDQSQVPLHSSVTFTITVRNTGTADMTGILVQDDLPAGLSFQAAYPSADFDETTGIWTVGDLSPGESAVLDIQARLVVKRTLTNVAEVFFAHEVDIDSTPNNGVTTEDDYDTATVTWRGTTGFSHSTCVDMGNITALVYDPVSGQLFAGTETGVVHISNDQGRSWPPFLITGSEIPIKDIVVSPGGVVYAATFGGGMYQSDDAGYTWSQIGPTGGKFMDAFHDDDHGKLYVADFGAVRMWNGLGWSIVGAGSNPFASRQVTDVAVDLSTGHVYASSNIDGVHVFDGVSWTSARSSLPPGSVVASLHGTHDGAFVGLVNGGIYRRAGGLWQPFGTGVETQTIVTISSGPAGQLLLGTGEMGAYYFNDATSTWINAVNLPAYTVSAITAGPLGELYAGTPGQGVYTFVDSNGDFELDMWHQISTIVANAVIQDLVAAPTGELFAATYGYGILYSIDGGNCWMRLNRGLVNLYTYAIERASDGTLFIGIWADGKGGVWRSVDNGRSWQYMALGNRQIISLAIDPNNENIIYAGANLAGEGAIFKSTDGGATWQQLFGIITPVWSIEVDPNDSRIILAGTLGAGVFRSTDGGATFAQYGNQYTGLGNGYVYDLQVGPEGCPYEGQIFAATARGVYRVDEYGHWSLMGSGSEDFDIRTIAFLGNAMFAGTWAQGVLQYDIEWDVWEDAGFGTLPVVAFAVVEATQTLIVGTNGSGFFIGENLVDASASSTANEPATTIADLPDDFRLDAAYPNPFNPQTTIPFALSESANVRLAVYDLLGRQVSVLVDGFMAAGEHEAVFVASGIPTGTYIVRLQAESRTATRMLTLIK